MTRNRNGSRCQERIRFRELQGNGGPGLTLSEVTRTVELIADAARTGKIGDGKVWSTPLDGVLRIRTGEVDDDAI